ncbi:MAG: hypothetical protein HY006_03980 [Candidatus Sungbacteria bacterium]|nr:hypothetical protein [Candidatus Sungbacteria bacterium]
MTEEQKKNEFRTFPQNTEPHEKDLEKVRDEQRIQSWRFWFSIVLTAFLIVVFVFYLPMRFQYNMLIGTHGQMDATQGAGMIMDGGQDGHGANAYHEAKDIREGLSVDLSISPVPMQSGTSTRLDFLVNQKPAGTPIPADALEIKHTKLMHVIGLRDDMNEFFHIHPVRSEEFVASLASSRVSGGVHPALVATSGLFTIQHVFGKPGLYKLWSEVKKDNISHSFGHELVGVQGEGERSHKEVSFTRNVAIDGYQVSLAGGEPVVKGQEAHLAFDIHAPDNTDAAVEKYLGADMHLSVIKDDLAQFIHTHPENDDGHMTHQGGGSYIVQTARANGAGGHAASPDTEHGIQFHVVFPEAGLYKAFAQFRPKGISLPPDEALMASFWIQVQESVPVNPKPLLVLFSLSAIVLLSWGVRRFLRYERK